MRREQKYLNTDVFEFYNANPKGKFGGDCVIRAISLATGVSWENTVLGLTHLGIQMGLVCNDKHTFEKYLQDNG